MIPVFDTGANVARRFSPQRACKAGLCGLLPAFLVLALLLPVAGWAGPAGTAWDVVFASEQLRGLPAVATGTYVLPACEGFDRREVAAALAKGYLTLGLLDVGCHDPRRTQPPPLATDKLWFPVPMWRNQRRPVRFFLDAWKTFLQGRLERLTGVGCRGIVLAGAHVPEIISDHPLVVEQMRDLLRWVIAETGRRLPRGATFLLVESPEVLRLAEELPVSGVILEGFWFRPDGRRRHEWQRRDMLACVQRLQAQGKEVLTLEPWAARLPLATMMAENAALHLKTAVAPIPLMPHWRFLP